ncbi:transposase [Actinoplanes sp. NPDC051851]|uniref:transposase n=1 Tax=Actinoplanes sp. NPDC051851 TaxID=3154753 RepID=UPI00343A2BEB
MTCGSGTQVPLPPCDASCGIRVRPVSLPRPPGPGSRSLGIDEVRCGRPRWSFDEVTASWTTTVDRWHVGFVDLVGGQGLLAQVESRTSKAVTDCLTARPRTWREQVQAVAVDVCTVFKAAVREALPHALLVEEPRNWPPTPAAAFCPSPRPGPGPDALTLCWQRLTQLPAT